MLGSLSATLIQGIMLGAFVQGFTLTGPSHPLQWLTPFSLFTGCALVCGYTLLGASRLILKTQNGIQAKMYRLARNSAILVSCCLIIASVWTYWVHPAVIQLWFPQDKLGLIALLPLTAIVMLIGLFIALAKQHERLPYWLTIGIFLCSYLGFIISVWPDIVPYSITIEQAAAPASSLSFMLVGAGIMLPVLLVYRSKRRRLRTPAP